MEMTVRRHWGEHIATIVVVGVLSGAITFVEVVQPSPSDVINRLPWLSQAVIPREQAGSAHQTDSKEAATPASISSVPVTKKAVTNSFVHLRAGKSTDSSVIMDLPAGTEVVLGDDSNAQWQGVTYGGKQGYLFKTYLSY